MKCDRQVIRLEDLKLDELVEKCVGKVVEQFRKEKLLVEVKRTAYEKTEQILYKYPVYKQVLDLEEKHVADMYPDVPGYVPPVCTPHPLQGRNEIIAGARQYIEFVDNTLKLIEGEKYAAIIELWYFKGMAREEIAVELGCEVSTVTRNKNNLVNKLKVAFFPIETMNELKK